MPERRQSRSNQMTAMELTITPCQENHRPAMPSLRILRESTSGVLAFRFVATIDRPANQNGIFRPATMKSSVPESALPLSR